MSANVSWIKKVGLGIVKGFEWFASPSGQKVVKEAESVVELAYPPSAPIVELVDAWANTAAVIEGKAQAAVSIGAGVSGEQKAIAAIAAVTPDVEPILQKYNLLPLSPDSLKRINDAVLTIANELVPAPPAA